MPQTTHSPSSTTPCGPAWSARGPAAEPPIDLDTMLDLTANAEVDGVEVRRRRPVPVPTRTSTSIPATTTSSGWPTRSPRTGLAVGSVVAPVWPAAGGGSAMGTRGGAQAVSSTQVRKACRIGRRLRELGVRPYGVVRIDSATGVDDWDERPRGQHEAHRRDLQARPATSPRTTASASPPRARSAGAACTPGATMVDLLEARRRARDASASRPTWPTRCSTRSATTPPRTASCPRTSTGTTRPRSTPR